LADGSERQEDEGGVVAEEMSTVDCDERGLQLAQKPDALIKDPEIEGQNAVPVVVPERPGEIEGYIGQKGAEEEKAGWHIDDGPRWRVLRGGTWGLLSNSAPPGPAPGDAGHPVCRSPPATEDILEHGRLGCRASLGRSELPYRPERVLPVRPAEGQ
jgi:hypothetical protein